jgi:hypothetical protein
MGRRLLTARTITSIIAFEDRAPDNVGKCSTREFGGLARSVDRVFTVQSNNGGTSDLEHSGTVAEFFSLNTKLVQDGQQ